MNHFPKEFNLKKIAVAFNDKYVKYKNEVAGKELLIEDYLEEIRPYLRDVTNDPKKSGEWKIQLTMEMHFMSSKNSNGKVLMHSKSDKKEIMTGFDTEELTGEHFDSILHRYQVG